LLDQSHIQQHEGEFEDVDVSKVKEESSYLEGGGTGEADIYSDWEGIVNSVSEIEAGQEENSLDNEASLPDT
jgi:hypothetical protein